MTSYTSKLPTVLGAYDEIEELRHFNRLTPEGKRRVLLGQAGFSVGLFDIEATHLKANVGRVLAAVVKNIKGPAEVFSCLEAPYKRADVYDDSFMASAILEALEEFDILVGWNSKEFDTKFLNARAMRGGYLTKLPQYHVDGMWAWRSKAAAWSGLDSAQKFIAGGAHTKKTSVAWDQWMRAIGWSHKHRQTAMDEILDHCQKDIKVLDTVYRKMIEANVIRGLRKDGGVI